MSEPRLDDSAQPGVDNTPEFTVSELSGAVKRTIEGAYERVRVRGELGRVLRARSGHLYADLKDEKAVLAGVMWKGMTGALTFKPEEGLEVVAEGRLTTYPGQSKYQLIIDRMTPAGVGALMALLEARKKQLAAEGLFDPERKAPIPFLPDVIGVVTSPTGAVIRDILHRVRDRFPRHVLVWPSLVQGDKAAGQIAAGIAGFNALAPGGAVPRPDVIIVARGGGSIEDLWAFNEEVVARAVAASDIPVISAVGHETDTTLIDYVADRRAPTPTGAAEMAVPVRAELLARVETLGGRLATGLVRGIERRRSDLTAAARGMPRPDDLLGPGAQRVDTAGERLRLALLGVRDRASLRVSGLAGRLRPEALSRDLDEKRRRTDEAFRQVRSALRAMSERRRARLSEAGERLAAQDLTARLTRRGDDVTRAAGRLVTAGARVVRDHTRALEAVGARLEAVNPRAVLERGYALVRDEAGVVTRAERLTPGAAVTLEFADGVREAVVNGAGGAGPLPPKASRAKPRKPKPTSSDDPQDDPQGALF